VANATRISGVLDIAENLAENDRLILVSSAISGCTDALLSRDKSQYDLLKEKHHSIIRRLFTSQDRTDALEECDSLFREINALPDVVEAYGEILSTKIIARKLALEGVPSLWLDSRQLIVDSDMEKTYWNIAAAVEARPDVKIFVAPGFIASDKNGNTVTLGRGGSDYSAALFAAAVGASRLEIWTDVPGIMTTNPKDDPKAAPLEKISYRAAFCMAEQGAKVLYPPTIKPILEKGIPLYIKDSFHPQLPGTLVSEQKAQSKWIGATLRGDELCIVSEGSIDRKEAEGKLDLALRKGNIGINNKEYGPDWLRLSLEEGTGKASLEAIHREFFEIDEKNTRLCYLAGKGAVGGALEELINQNAERLHQSTGKTIRIVDSANSSRPDFCKEVLEKAVRGSVFVDCTDSFEIYKWYAPLLEAGINIVSSNRRSLAVPYAEYAKMKTAALKGGSFFRYETTVGAALPMLGSIALSANSCDEILGIEAVVSCTLNYVLSSDLPYMQALQKAREIGLTEKDPQQDLQGRDALRKLLILAREAGVHLDEEDVEIEVVKDLSNVGENQRYVASLVKDSAAPLGYRARIGLQTVDENHPAYWIKGTDNVIVIRSAFHPTPLIIRGAGEGAKQAASRLLNDILR